MPILIMNFWNAFNDHHKNTEQDEPKQPHTSNLFPALVSVPKMMIRNFSFNVSDLLGPVLIESKIKSIYTETCTYCIASRAAWLRVSLMIVGLRPNFIALVQSSETSFGRGSEKL